VPIFARCTLAIALQLRKKHGKPSVRVAENDSWHDKMVKFVLDQAMKAQKGCSGIALLFL